MAASSTGGAREYTPTRLNVKTTNGPLWLSTYKTNRRKRACCLSGDNSSQRLKKISPASIIRISILFFRFCPHINFTFPPFYTCRNSHTYQFTSFNSNCAIFNGDIILIPTLRNEPLSHGRARTLAWSSFLVLESWSLGGGSRPAECRAIESPWECGGL